MDHTGPLFRLQDLGYPGERYVYLPSDLLELLYARFRAANPSGVTLTTDDSVELMILRDRYTEDEMLEMDEQGRAFFRIDVEAHWEGYPHVRPYLSELYEPTTTERLANDPWLDYQLLERAEFLGPNRGGIRPDLWVDRSARWSPEWRAFCDKLTPLDWSPTNSWNESMLHPESKFYRHKDEKVRYWPE